MNPLEGKPVVMLEGDVQTPDHAGQVIEGTIAVLVALGQRPPYSDVFCEGATVAILEAMRRHGVQRIIAVTGALVGVVDQGQSRMVQHLARLFAERQPAAAADRASQERVLMESDREWTIVKPPRLNEAPMRRTKSGTRMKIGMLSRISRADLAMFMLDQIDSTEYVRKRVLVKA
jgi:putative NADH-flavin reductase